MLEGDNARLPRAAFHGDWWVCDGFAELNGIACANGSVVPDRQSKSAMRAGKSGLQPQMDSRPQTAACAGESPDAANLAVRRDYLLISPRIVRRLGRFSTFCYAGVNCVERCGDYRHRHPFPVTSDALDQVVITDPARGPRPCQRRQRSAQAGLAGHRDARSLWACSSVARIGFCGAPESAT